MDRDDLNAVLSTRRAGSINRAARMLGVDQPATARRLVRVHGELRLVNRRLHLHSYPDLTGWPRICATMDWILDVVDDVFCDPEASDR